MIEKQFATKRVKTTYRCATPQQQQNAACRTMCDAGLQRLPQTPPLVSLIPTRCDGYVTRFMWCGRKQEWVNARVTRNVSPQKTNDSTARPRCLSSNAKKLYCRQTQQVTGKLDATNEPQHRIGCSIAGYKGGNFGFNHDWFRFGSTFFQESLCRFPQTRVAIISLF